MVGGLVRRVYCVSLDSVRRGLALTSRWAKKLHIPVRGNPCDYPSQSKTSKRLAPNYCAQSDTYSLIDTWVGARENKARIIHTSK